MSFQTLGILVIAVLGAIWIFAGLKVSKKVKGTDDYLVGGRNVGVALGSATILATWVTGNTILAAPESGYTYGVLGVLGYAVGGGLAVIAFAPLAARLKEILPGGRTVGDFFRLRFDGKNYWLFLVMLLIWDLGWLLTQAMAAGIILESIFGIPFQVGVIATVLIVLAYVTIGGMISVLSTDFMQTLLIMILVFVFPALVYWMAGPRVVYDGMLTRMPETLQLDNPAGLLFLCVIPLVYIGEVFMDNTFWQRAFALRKSVMKKTFTYAGIGWIFVPIATGTLAFVAVGTGLELPGGPSSVAPEVVAEHAGTLGSVLFLALLWAALASTMAALLNGVAGIFMNDIYNNVINKRATDKQVLWSGRVATVVLAAITIATALARPTTLLSLLIWLGVINAAYIIPIVSGAFFKRTNPTGVFVSVITGVLAGLTFYGGGALDLLFFKIPLFDFPEWASGDLQGAVVSFTISALGVLISTKLFPRPYDFRKMRDWKPASAIKTGA
ncbi:hypothetical protein JD276_11250 [Leucobacter sp. CSA1]|uniref:Na+/proline symporter n=1 Tax=Leucobacter chromiisoli TaxID=2796471 RepID=A0A934Q7D0_9MICO|nr:hypothetical protein [Leucobacter chromiisoli]MBK0419609.1 hypothetical protein [Leucobacter chromiisoli]